MVAASLDRPKRSLAAWRERVRSPAGRRIALAAITAAAFAFPLIDRNDGDVDAAANALAFAILALGLNIVVGFAGLLDLGYAAFFAIGAYTSAFLTSPISPLPFRTDYWVAMVISFVVAALFGVM